MNTKEISYISKEINNLPKNAEILEKDIRINVEEIENGFLIIKISSTKYKDGDRNDWLHSTKKYFSKTNPLKIEEKTLAEKFD